MIQVRKLKSMFEVIERSEQEWNKPENKVHEFGRISVIIADKEKNICAMTVQNLMPMPRMIKFEDDHFEKNLKKVIEVVEQAGGIAIVIKESLYKVTKTL